MSNGCGLHVATAAAAAAASRRHGGKSGHRVDEQNDSGEALSDRLLRAADTVAEGAIQQPTHQHEQTQVRNCQGGPAEEGAAAAHSHVFKLRQAGRHDHVVDGRQRRLHLRSRQFCALE